MPKPPILEILRFSASPRMLRWLLVILFAILIPTVRTSLAREFFPGLSDRAAVRPTFQVPELGWTTEGGTRPETLQASIPEKPGPNQKRAGSCKPERSEMEINGGCWVQTTHPLPCPEGVQWEHQGRCWLPVAPAARLPSSGGSLPVSIAE